MKKASSRDASRLVFPSYLHPSLEDTFERDAYIYDIYDGDTVYYHALLGYNTAAMCQTGRLLDVWAAEIRPLVSREQGTAAKEQLQSLLERYALNRHSEQKPFGLHLRIRSQKADNRWFPEATLTDKGKYGRWLITIIGADDNGMPFDINAEMVRTGFATSTREA